MKIYTGRGDRGETDLFGGPRVGKDDPRVEAYGEVDELNAAVGLAAALMDDDEVRGLCAQVQTSLFDLGAYLATPDAARREKSGVAEPGGAESEELERRIDAFDAELAPLRAFVLPGGTPAAAAFHQARTVCRRAERRLVTLARDTPLSEAVLRYVNRLSDLLFTLARVANHRAGVPDVEWVGRRR